MIEKLKNDYNKILEKINKQEEWIIKNKNHKKIDLFIKKFQESLIEAEQLINKIEFQENKEMEKQEILEGFKI